MFHVVTIHAFALCADDEKLPCPPRLPGRFLRREAQGMKVCTARTRQSARVNVINMWEREHLPMLCCHAAAQVQVLIIKYVDTLLLKQPVMKYFKEVIYK